MCAKKTALVVGGTGPTGPHIVNGLLARGYEVTLFHRGTHESEDIPDHVEHIHGDPHFMETIQASLGRREFDLVVAAYGRTRLIAKHLEGRAGKFIAIGAIASTKGHYQPDALFPTGLPIPSLESEEMALVEEGPDGRFAWRIAQTELAVFASHPAGTILRYPIVYGPHQLLPLEWTLVRRALDRRPFVILPEGGLRLVARGYSRNMAHSVLCAVDHPEVSAGQAYNCGDERQLTLRQVAEIVADVFDHQWEIVDIPAPLAWPAWPLIYTDATRSYHRFYGIEKIKCELGYRDLTPSPVALAETARWFAIRRNQLAGDIERRLEDSFDYAAEDSLRSDWSDAMSALMAKHGRTFLRAPHPYAHPKAAGQAKDHLDR